MCHAKVVYISSGRLTRAPIAFPFGPVNVTQRSSLSEPVQPIEDQRAGTYLGYPPHVAEDAFLDLQPHQLARQDVPHPPEQRRVLLRSPEQVVERLAVGPKREREGKQRSANRLVSQ